MAHDFYETLALAAFALLGLWWVVVADRRREWSLLPYRRRQAYSVSLYFTVTGIISMVSLISGDHPEIWRTAFGLAGAIGAIEVVLSLMRARGEPQREKRGDQLLGLALPLYVLIIVIAIHPSLAENIGIDLKPLQIEAIVVSCSSSSASTTAGSSSWSRRTKSAAPNRIREDRVEPWRPTQPRSSMPAGARCGSRARTA